MNDQQRTIELADCRRHMETRPYVLELRFFPSVYGYLFQLCSFIRGQSNII